MQTPSVGPLPGSGQEEQPVANNGVQGASTEAAEFVHFLHCFGWVFLEDGGFQFL